MSLSTVPQYEEIAETHINGNKGDAIQEIGNLPIARLTDFIRYCCDRLEGSNNVNERQTWRTLRHHTLNRIDAEIITQ